MAKPKKNKIEEIKIKIVGDPDPDTSFLDQKEFKDRKREFQRGGFDFVGIYAEALIAIPHTSGGSVTQQVRSPGLWGIESDSERSYFREVGETEMDELEAMLKNLNVDISPLKSSSFRRGVLDAIRGY